MSNNTYQYSPFQEELNPSQSWTWAGLGGPPPESTEREKQWFHSGDTWPTWPKPSDEGRHCPWRHVDNLTCDEEAALTLQSASPSTPVYSWGKHELSKQVLSKQVPASLKQWRGKPHLKGIKASILSGDYRFMGNQLTNLIWRNLTHLYVFLGEVSSGLPLGLL